MLGERIAALRRNAGMSQADLALRLQVSASAVGMYEQGRREPSADTLVALAKIFGTTTDYLLTGKASGRNDEELLGKILMRSLSLADQKLDIRGNRPFTRQELAVLFAAMLTEP